MMVLGHWLYSSPYNMKFVSFYRNENFRSNMVKDLIIATQWNPKRCMPAFQTVCINYSLIRYVFKGAHSYAS